MFCSTSLVDLVVSCDTDPKWRGPGADHMLILTTLDLEPWQTVRTITHNFRAVAWDGFREELEARLSQIKEPHVLGMETQVHDMVSALTEAIQEIIRSKVLVVKQAPYVKRWWNNELSVLKRSKNKLSGTSYRYRGVSDHPSHKQHRAAML